MNHVIVYFLFMYDHTYLATNYLRRCLELTFTYRSIHIASYHLLELIRSKLAGTFRAGNVPLPKRTH